MVLGDRSVNRAGTDTLRPAPYRKPSPNLGVAMRSML